MKSKKLPNVFSYTNYRKFLRDCFKYKKGENKRYSLRVLAGQIGIKSHGYFKEIIDGKRNLTDKTVYMVIKPLKLTKSQATYFYNLVMFNQAKDRETKNKYFSEMVKLQRQPRSKTITASQYVYYKDWFNSVIWTIISLKNFKNDPEWIAKKIYPPITAAQVKKALKLLIRLGLIKENGKGKLEQKTSQLDIDPDVSSLFIRNFNRNMIELGKEAIESFPQEKREVSGLTISISEEGYRHIKEIVRECKRQVAEYVNSDQRDEDLVCQLNFQLFPLTKGKGKGNE